MPVEKHNFWDDLDYLVKAAEGRGLHGVANVLKLYEAERKRQITAINNLEDQIQTLVKMTYTREDLAAILSRAGLDLEVILKTDEIFGGES